jgi:hypothetical protein
MHEQRDLALFRSLGAFFIVANGCVGTTACSTHKTETTELAPPFVFHLIRKRLCLAASELRVPVFMPTGHAGTPVPGIGWGACGKASPEPRRQRRVPPRSEQTLAIRNLCGAGGRHVVCGTLQRQGHPSIVVYNRGRGGFPATKNQRRTLLRLCVV